MRYIADSDGYVKEVSFGADIVCGDDTCTEYTGSVPTGYASLEAWFIAEAEKLYRWQIVDGNLTLDSSAAVPVDAGDTGWVNLTPAKGTWTFLKYRKVGNTVNIRGHATAYTWDGSIGELVVTLPEEIQPNESANIYFWGVVGGKRIAKLGISAAGKIFLDSILYIPDGSNVTTSMWLNFNITYMLGGYYLTRLKSIFKGGVCYA